MRRLISILGFAGSIILTNQAAGAENPALKNVSKYFESTVGSCWIIPADIDLSVVTRVKVRLNRDGSLAEKPEPLDRQTEPQRKILNDSAVRAVVRCAPYSGLAAYADSYETWREMTVSFDARVISSSGQPK
ncbi:cell envelope integrity protein TolA [Mesorhizobium sp. GbtcB19]|uniref:cell envelope integrity protein TolA n=1 Tax=Mesorhizobium sp. GbtcB19 TaxID=2824764 RepID=UPI001C2F6512|nr:cell envelope integrity protein TolA [Mesorhizobium sp. GbtcB19]